MRARLEVAKAKSLAYAASLPRATNPPAPVGLNPEEQDKTLGGYAVAAPPIIAFDNVRGGISNQCLENALTTPIYGFRVLGVHEIMMLPFRSIVTFTGNNLSFVGDMIRRIIIGRLGPQTEHPDKLRPEDFRIPFIEQFVKENRGKIVSAILTIVRAYVLAGMPSQGLRMGSFDRASGGRWIELIGGAIAWCDAGDITQFSGKKTPKSPRLGARAHPTWKVGQPRRRTWRHNAFRASRHALRPTSSNISAKGTRGNEGEQDWRSDRVDCRAALQALAKCPDRAVPDSTKLGNGLRPYVDRWFSAAGKERRFVHALSPVTKRPFVPARWKVEERWGFVENESRIAQHTDRKNQPRCARTTGEHEHKKPIKDRLNPKEASRFVWHSGHQITLRDDYAIRWQILLRQGYAHQAPWQVERLRGRRPAGRGRRRVFLFVVFGETERILFATRQMAK